jgi:predicted CopG family antitoxin
VPNLTLSISAELYEAMKKHPEVRWSEVARGAISKRLRDLETLDEILSKSTLTERDVKEIAERVNKGVWEKVAHLPRKQRSVREKKRRT